MKTALLVFALGTFGLAGVFSGCSSTKPVDIKNAAALSPETVFITFHVKTGKEVELQQVLADTWKLYRKEKLVLAEPHVLLRGPEIGGTRMVEIFTWMNHTIPDHVPNSVRAQWNRMQLLCEERGGHPGLEGGEVERLIPPVK
jgi:hypothetical protein